VYEPPPINPNWFTHFEKGLCMKRKRLLFIAGAIGIVLVSIYFLQAFFVKYYVRFHQEHVILELQDIQKRYSHIKTWEQAIDAIRMLEYIKGYYQVGPGYRSYSETDARLECQRERTIQGIIDALREYTGKDFGDNLYQWEEAIRDMSWRENETTTTEAEPNQRGIF